MLLVMAIAWFLAHFMSCWPPDAIDASSRTIHAFSPVKRHVDVSRYQDEQPLAITNMTLQRFLCAGLSRRWCSTNKGLIYCTTPTAKLASDRLKVPHLSHLWCFSFVLMLDNQQLQAADPQVSFTLRVLKA